jgi:carboxylesterase type B
MTSLRAMGHQAGRRAGAAAGRGRGPGVIAILCVGLVVGLAALTVVAAQARRAASPELVGPVRVRQGQLTGVPGRNPAITVFKGVPYALPPTGNRRWRAPEPAAAWTGIRSAAAFGPACIQQIVQEKKPWTYEFMAHDAVSEDCLVLNVWTPARAANERHPVLIYIHGGANTEGSGSVPAYDGEGLAGKGLVVVTINYRLGIFGFLAHPELTAEATSSHASGNYGLLDQIAAVRWVHDNIQAFGGDAARITIDGQSAGASAVHNLTASPLARGLFQRAIAESGGSSVTGGGMRLLADQEADGVRFAKAKGAASLAALRAMSWQDLFAPIPTDGRGGAGRAAPFRWGPVVDGYALPASVRDIFASGRQNDVPTLTGANADEGGASPKPTATAASFAAQARQRYGADADAFLALYPAASDEQARLAQNTSARDLARVSMYLWALDRGKTAKTSAYTYFWTHPLPGPDAGTYGAFHTSEVPYALDTLGMSSRPFTADDRRIADAMSSYWVNFATTGNPNGTGLPDWPAVSARAATTMEIGERIGAIPIAESPAAVDLLTRLLRR